MGGNFAFFFFNKCFITYLIIAYIAFFFFFVIPSYPGHPLVPSYPGHPLVPRTFPRTPDISSYPGHPFYPGHPLDIFSYPGHLVVPRTSLVNRLYHAASHSYAKWRKTTTRLWGIIYCVVSMVRYDVTNPATMTSLTPLLCTMTSLTPLL